VDDSSALAEVVEAKIEDASALAIDHSNAQRGLGSEQSGERFQLKARLKINLRRADMRRQFIFFPEILRGAGEDRLAANMAAKVGGNVENAIKVGVE
jgi:hypothetical protein